MGILLKAITLHQPVTLPGIIGADKTLNKEKYPKLKMTWEPDCVLLTIDGKVGIIPHAGIAGAIVDEKAK